MKINIFSRSKKKTIRPFDDLYDILYNINSQDNSKIAKNIDVYKKNVWANRCINISSTKISNAMCEFEKISAKGIAILNNPDIRVSYRQFIEKIDRWLHTYGFVYLEYDDTMRKIRILDSDRIQWTGKKLLYNDPLIRNIRTLDITKIALINNYVLQEYQVGISTISSIIASAKLQGSLQYAAKKVLDNGAIIPFILTTERDMGKPVIERIKEQFQQAFTGIGNAGRVPILHSGMKPERVGLSPLDMGILQLSDISKNEISTAFGVPNIYMNDMANVNYATATIQRRIFIEDTIIPRANMIISQLNNELLPIIGEKNGVITIDFTNLPEMREDEEKKSKIYVEEIRVGLRTINEIREERGLPKVPWGDKYWHAYSLTTEDMIAQQRDNSDSKTVKKTNGLSDYDRRTYKWKMFITRTLPQENKLVKELNKFFTKQEKYIIEQVKTINSAIKKGIDLPPDWDTDLEKMLTPYLKSFMQQSADATIDEYGLNIDFDLGNPEAATWIKWKINKSALEINNTTRDQLSAEFEEALLNGESAEQISARVSKVFKQAKDYRSMRIARTEVNAVNNKGSQIVASEAGMQKKVWIAARDEKTREWHLEADGQERKMKEPYSVAGENMQHPSDPNGSAENVINCRCTEEYY